MINLTTAEVVGLSISLLATVILTTTIAYLYIRHRRYTSNKRRVLAQALHKEGLADTMSSSTVDGNFGMNAEEISRLVPRPEPAKKLWRISEMSEGGIRIVV